MPNSKTPRPYTGPEPYDERLKPVYWKNEDKFQCHYFQPWILKKYSAESCRAFMGPAFKDLTTKVIECKPGEVVMLMHRYYTVRTRDESDIKGVWLHGEAVEEAAPSSLTHGHLHGQE